MIQVTDTGWFGVPGREGGLVHAVYMGRPICGTVMHPEAQFQWCCHGLNFSWIECERCKSRIQHDSRWKHEPADSDRFERYVRGDGAAVSYNSNLMGPETNINLPGHRGWIARPPDAAEHSYLGYFPKRWRRGGRSRMFVPVKFKTARAAMQALDKAFPWPKT